MFVDEKHCTSEHQRPIIHGPLGRRVAQVDLSTGVARHVVRRVRVELGELAQHRVGVTDHKNQKLEPRFTLSAR